MLFFVCYAIKSYEWMQRKLQRYATNVRDTYTTSIMTAVTTQWEMMMAVIHCNSSGGGREQRPGWTLCSSLTYMLKCIATLFPACPTSLSVESDWYLWLTLPFPEKHLVCWWATHCKGHMFLVCVSRPGSGTETVWEGINKTATIRFCDTMWLRSFSVQYNHRVFPNGWIWLLIGHLYNALRDIVTNPAITQKQRINWQQQQQQKYLR